MSKYTDLAMERRSRFGADGKPCYNCAQAVVCTYCDLVGLPEQTALDIAGAFGIGMGNMEGTWGALVGAGMIAGLKTEGSRTLIYTKQIVDEFKANCGATRCRDLKGIDTGKVLCPCDDCVRNAVRAYEKVMEQFAGA